MRLIAAIVFLISFISPAIAQEEEVQDRRAVKVAVYESDPFVSRADDDSLTGYDIALIEQIAFINQWNISYVQVDRFSDLLERVEDEEVDIAISSITITPERERSVDFSQPYMHTGLGILVSEDRSTTMSEAIGSWISTRVPLAVDLLTICFFFIIALMFWGIVLYLTDEQRKADAADEDGLTFMEVVRGSADSMWLAFTTGSTIGYGEVYPRKTAARITAVFCFFTVAILVSSLTATITSFNVVQQINVGIQGAGDLKGKTVATVGGTTSVSSAARYGANVETYDNIDQAIAAVILGNADAVVYDEPRLRYFANNQGRNKVRLVDTVFESQDYGIAFVQGSNLRESANVALLSMQDKGELSEFEHSYFGAP
tara:strand:+ start:34081 stop:35196 length:1116 start_codon:yes stop_codon:yes gene_type:complete